MLNSNESSRKIKEDKYKILRMSLILANESDPDAISDFETSAREIDAMNQEVFENEISKKYYKTKTLEKEKERLENLISFIESRVFQRDALKDDFYNVTGIPLTALEPIRDEDRLFQYKDRLNYINEYLDNMNNIEKANKDIEEFGIQLEEAQNTKEENEEQNFKYENELLELFKKVTDSDICSLNSKDSIDNELDKINPSILDSKKSLDIFNKSFNSLKKAGISGKEEREYYSYVVNARKDYYSKMEKYFLLSLYRTIITINNNFEEVFNKRNKIKEILADRESLRANLEINTEDILLPITKILNRQYEEIKIQAENINNITYLKEKIDTRKEELEKYKDDNQKIEIISLLREYNLIEEYEEEHQIEDDSSDDLYDFSKTFDFAETNYELTEPISEEIADNMIVSVKDSTSLDIISAREKAKSVMIKVGKMLEETGKEKPIQKEIEISNNKINDNNAIANNNQLNKNITVPNDNLKIQDDSNTIDELELPTFDDLPTVSSLTSKTNTTSNSTTPNSTTSFWGNEVDNFEFPDLNNWSDK